MRVAVLAATCLPWHRYGGLERHVFQLCRWLRRRQVEVDLFTSRPERRADPFAGDGGFRLRVIPGTPFRRERFAVALSRSTLYPIFSLRMGAEVAREAGSRAYAAVIAQGLSGFGYALWTARRSPTPPLILNPQGMEESLTPSIAKRLVYSPFRRLVRWTAARAAVTVATDESSVAVVERVLRVPRERIRVIPNAIDVEECLAYVSGAKAATVRQQIAGADTAPLLVTVGRLAPNKGFDVGLAAMSQAAARLPPTWRWIVVGEGPERGTLLRRAAEHGVRERVGFVGNLGDAEMHNLLAAADLFLNPTLYEGSSLVTLEAMSHACPIVATRAGGIPDKIEDGRSGWLAEPGSARSLAEAVGRWHATSAEERTRIGQAAQTRCRERFDWPVCVARYLAAIDELAAQ